MAANTNHRPMGPRPGGHGPGGMMPGEKARDFKGSMKKLLGYLAPYLPGIGVALVCAAASTVFAIFGPKILGQATTELFNGLIAMLTGTGGIDFGVIGAILLTLAALYLASALLSYLQGWLMSGVATKLSYSMRRDISNKIDKLPLAYFDRVQSGEVLSRITNDVDTVTQTLNQSLSQIVSNVATLIGVLVMMLTISPVMTLVALCILPVSVLIVSQVVRRSQPFFRRQQEMLGHVNGHVEEMYGGHVILTAFNGQQESIHTFNRLNEDLYKAGWKSQFLSGMMMPLMNGIELCGKVKSNLAYSHIPFILLTAKTTLESKTEGLESGADAYIEKPFSIKQLHAQIENLFKLRNDFRRQLADMQEGTRIDSLAASLNGKDREFVEQLQKLIEEQVANENFSIDTFAEKANMSRSNFYRKIKSLTGLSPNEFVKITRLRHAARLLLNGCSVAEAAEQSGFASSSYFAKCFKARYGVLPKDYNGEAPVNHNGNLP